MSLGNVKTGSDNREECGRDFWEILELVFHIPEDGAGAGEGGGRESARDIRWGQPIGLGLRCLTGTWKVGGSSPSAATIYD